jgi:serine kinase of HPr protein (carbohydrate metabolism regulator)
MLRGASSIGKSETALNLLDRGHIFIADDSLGIDKTDGKLIGYNAFDKYLLHSRYLGVLNIETLFAKQQIKKRTEIQLVIDCIDRPFNEPILTPVFYESEVEECVVKTYELNYRGLLDSALQIELLTKIFKKNYQA